MMRRTLINGALALSLAGVSPRSYLVFVLCLSMERLDGYEPMVRYTRREFTKFAHELLLAGIICDRLP